VPTRVLRKDWWQAISATKAAILASIAVFVAFAAIGYVAYSSRANQTNNCIASLRVRDLVVQILEDAKHQNKRPQAQIFYNKELRRAARITCNRAIAK
jgi:hypothetical protein